MLLKLCVCVEKSLVNAVFTAPKEISECRRNLQFTSSLDKDQSCVIKRVKKRKLVSNVLEEANGNVCLAYNASYFLLM